MVLKGQFLERATVVQAGGFWLEALSHRGSRQPPLLLCPPPPESGGSMDSPVLSELAFASAIAGFPTLRFNYRGVGASQGVRGGEEARLADAACSLALLLENAGGTVAAVGGQAEGAALALRLAADRGAALAVAVAPRGIDLGACARLTIPVLFVVGEDDPGLDRNQLAAHCQATGDRLVVVPGADHAFTRGLSEVGRACVEFLATLGR